METYGRSNKFAMAEIPSEQERYLFIDLFRGAAILFMLQGHTFRALLDPAIQQNPTYQFFELFHGITAPAFLFGAGLTFVISTKKRWREYHHIGPPLFQRIGRMMLVVFLGVALHLPYLSLRKIVADGTTEDYLQLFQFDILHCIGIGLLALQGLIFFFKRERRFYGLVLVSTAVVPLLTPLVWDIDLLRYYPPIIAQIFNAKHGSPFPLFPFVGFLFVGVIVSWEFLRALERNEEASFFRRLVWLGPLIAFVALLLDAQPVQLYPTYNFWYTSPNYFAIRVGALLLLTAAFWYGSRLIGNISAVNKSVDRAARAVTLLGKESLLVYVVHLPILYGSVTNEGVYIQKILGNHLDLGQTVLMFLVVLLSMGFLAKAWNTLKVRYRLAYRSTQLLVVAVFLYVFLTHAY